MGTNVDKYLVVDEHAVINHAGIPGVGGGGGIVGEIVPVGVIVPFGGTVASVPSGYLPCDGSTVSQSTYAALYTAIGTTWNTGGEPGGSFRLPDLRARTVAGINDGTLPAGVDGGFTTRTAADLAGTETTPSEGAHDHSVSHNHTISSDGAHAHNPAVAVSGGYESAFANNRSTPSAGAHNHTGTTGSSSISTTGSDGDHSHSIIEPTAFMPYIIKAEEGLPAVVGIGSDTLPIATLVSYSGSIASIPVGFLPCDGSAVSRITEADLFAVIGTTWGVGDGLSTFNLPDLRAKSIVGVNDGTLPAGPDGAFTNRVLAATGGSETNTTGGENQPAINVQTGITPVADSPHTHDIGVMHPFAVCSYIIKSKQVGGGIGTTAQNNGGTLQGPQPTLNFIPSGLIGLTVVENVPQNRIDITISATETFTSAVHASTNHTGIAGVGKVVQQWRTQERAVIACGTLLPVDNTAPQSTEGTLITSLQHTSIVPKSTSNFLLFEFNGSGTASAIGQAVGIALFRDSVAQALAASACVENSGVRGYGGPVTLTHYMPVPFVGAQTYKLRIGLSAAGTFYLNGYHTGTQYFNGLASSTLVISEMAP